MSSRTEIRTAGAPPPRPSNSQAIICNGIIFCSGAIGVDPTTGKLVEGPTTERAVRAIRNLEAILKEAGASLQDAIKVNVYLTDMTGFPEFNKVYETYFTGTPRPARTLVCVKELPLGTDVELELVAAIPKNNTADSAHL